MPVCPLCKRIGEGPWCGGTVGKPHNPADMVRYVPAEQLAGAVVALEWIADYTGHVGQVGDAYAQVMQDVARAALGRGQ